jgi:hypothetical protein
MGKLEGLNSALSVSKALDVDEAIAEITRLCAISARRGRTMETEKGNAMTQEILELKKRVELLENNLCINPCLGGCSNGKKP